MRKQLPLIVIVLIALTGLAIYLAVQSARSAGLYVVVLLAIAVIFWKRAQKLM